MALTMMSPDPKQWEECRYPRPVAFWMSSGSAVLAMRGAFGSVAVSTAAMQKQK